MEIAETPRARRRARRQARAEADRRRALSPIRILFKLAAIPVIAAGVAVSIYIRTSEYSGGDALRHLVAMGGCRAAAAVNLAPAVVGSLGYHARNDPDFDGVACPAAETQAASATRSTAPPERRAGGAKFIRPGG